MINEKLTEPKTVLRRSRHPETWFLGKYSFSPYRACQHACKYCDGRAEKYYVEGDFEKDIVIRRNLPEILAEELPKQREIGYIVIGSGVSDPYQPAEKQYQLMRKSAQLLSEYSFPVSILTKSALPLRDLDIWSEINQQSKVILFVSLIYFEDTLRKIFEPNAATIDERLDMIRIFRDAGITVGILAMPMLPGLTDSESYLQQFAQKVAENGIDFVMPGNLTLRPGIQKNTYLQVIKEHFPQLLPETLEIYKENRSSGNADYAYRKDFYKRFGAILRAYNLPTAIPHAIYKDTLPLYDELLILMNHMINLYLYTGHNIKRLETSAQSYFKWLDNEKKLISRSRTSSFSSIDNKIKNMSATNRLNDIFLNDKLAQFMQEIILGRKTFNYLSLKPE